MFSTVTNMINNVIKPNTLVPVTPTVRPVVTENPFAQPFIATQQRKENFYGKNNPVNGGYFAGYYNGKQNIVGRKLFINV